MTPSDPATENAVAQGSSAGVGLNARQRFLKRGFDVTAAAFGLLTVGWAIPVLALIARRSTGGSGVFRQRRVGLHGGLFDIRKLRTMRIDAGGTTVTTSLDPRVTRFGQFLRRTKLDELPQLIDVLIGQMSFVGPRPDVPECVDLEGPHAATILSVRPGITGPATLVYRAEERLLAQQTDPEGYNRSVLLPTKEAINARYVRNWTFRSDLRFVWMTVRRADLSLEAALS
jgi:lipopolysaccharide/colanic/teichoic acid biosynthesis glycosyltransferase